MAVFLASPGARNITGQSYNVDGGSGAELGAFLARPDAEPVDATHLLYGVDMQPIEDRLAIEDLFLEYARAMDFGEIDAVAALFTPDGRVRISRASYGTPLPAVRAALPPIGWCRLGRGAGSTGSSGCGRNGFPTTRIVFSPTGPRPGGKLPAPRL